MQKESQKIWFKAKEYGWGWYPCSWEGVLTLFMFVTIYVILLVHIINQNKIFNIISGAVIIFILLIIFIFVCYKKGEKPAWRWHGKIIKRRSKK